MLGTAGGAGKTTISVHLATAAMLAGYDAAVIDLDRCCFASKRLFGDVVPPNLVCC